MTELRTPSTAQEWDCIRVLLRECASQLGVDLCFQDFETELVRLPSHYGPPRGATLMAQVDAASPDCRVALPQGRPLNRPVRPVQAWAWANMVVASLTSNFPGASTFSDVTFPSLTSIE